MTPDLKRVEFSVARGKSALILAGGIALTALAVWISLSGAASGNLLMEFVAWFGTLFFGVCCLVVIVRMFESGPVVTIAATGLTDVRISPDPIPWDRIAALEVKDIMGQSFLVVTVDPEFEAAMAATRMARWSRSPNASLGFHGFPISMQGLNGSLDDLIGAVQRFSGDAAP